MTTRRTAGALRRLARMHGVQTAYYDVNHQRQEASVESLLAVLKAMGAPLETPEDAPEALRQNRQEHWRRPMDPVVVSWNGGPVELDIRLPFHLADSYIDALLTFQDGERVGFEWKGPDLPVVGEEDVEGYRYVVKKLSLAGAMPLGYHRLSVDVPGRPVETLVISAPLRAYSPGMTWETRTWGVFLPLYALHTETCWGSGSLSDMEALTSWVTSLGGGVVATLPLLAAFLDGDIYEPSPYAPVSRLMWNEFYLDIGRIPEFEVCKPAQEIVGSGAFQEALAALRKERLVDYRQQMALKRRVLEKLAVYCSSNLPERQSELRRFIEANPAVEDYARFRAASETQHRPWAEWPQGMREGQLQPGDFDEKARDYHLYVQWAARQQMESLSKRADESGLGLYLDLPLGVHPDGYDAWRYQDIFIHGTRVGAPPDAFFTRGQDWGFPPIHPERSRDTGHAYFIQAFRNHLRYAGVMRIDHVMGLHRLYWVPEGHDARFGAYVRYPAEELYAILSLESHEQLCWIVGENLGTVPSYVNEAMARHGLGTMYVAQFEMRPDPQKALRSVPSNAVASFNTHDMPTFAGYWHGHDIENRRQMGLIDETEAKRQESELEKSRKALIGFLKMKGHLKGDPTPEAVHAACMAYLGDSGAKLVLVTLEDLWQETQPQNVPGTSQERPNWRRKTRYSFEEFSQMPQVVDVLKRVDKLRRE